MKRAQAKRVASCRQVIVAGLVAAAVSANAEVCTQAQECNTPYAPQSCAPPLRKRHFLSRKTCPPCEADAEQAPAKAPAQSPAQAPAAAPAAAGPAMFAAPPAGGQIAGESNSVGIRGFELHIPETRLAMPTLQLPCLVRFRRNPEMQVDGGRAPLVAGAAAMYGQIPAVAGAAPSSQAPAQAPASAPAQPPARRSRSAPAARDRCAPPAYEYDEPYNCAPPQVPGVDDQNMGQADQPEGDPSYVELEQARRELQQYRHELNRVKRALQAVEGLPAEELGGEELHDEELGGMTELDAPPSPKKIRRSRVIEEASPRAPVIRAAKSTRIRQTRAVVDEEEQDSAIDPSEPVAPAALYESPQGPARGHSLPARKSAADAGRDGSRRMSYPVPVGHAPWKGESTGNPPARPQRDVPADTRVIARASDSQPSRAAEEPKSFRKKVANFFGRR